MEDGGADSAGRRRPRAASTERRSCSKKAGSFISAGSRHADTGKSRLALPLGIERLRNELAVSLLEKNLHAALGLFQLLLAFAREGDAFFKKLHRFIEGELGAFQAADDFL